jgi:tetratricopeptide (TPR) repeat protein
VKSSPGGVPEVVLERFDRPRQFVEEVDADEQAHARVYEPQALIPPVANTGYMTDSDPRSRETPDPGDHAFSEGQGFTDPYEGFDFDPGELRVDLDPDRIDPADSHALADLLDEAAIPDDEVDAEALLDVGLSYMRIRQFEEATEAFERTARFADDDRIEQEAWTNKGAAHAELEEYDAAIGAFREAIHIDEDSEHAATAHTNLAHALWEFGRTEEPLEHAERAVEIDERFAEAWYNRAFFLNERGLAEQALDSIENAIRLGFHNADVLEEKARALESLGEYEDAAAIEEEAEQLRERAEEELLQR